MSEPKALKISYFKISASQRPNKGLLNAWLNLCSEAKLSQVLVAPSFYWLVSWIYSTNLDKSDSLKRLLSSCNLAPSVVTSINPTSS